MCHHWSLNVGWPIHMLTSFQPDTQCSSDVRRWHLTLSGVNRDGISAPRPLAAVGPVSKVLSSLVGHHTCKATSALSTLCLAAQVANAHTHLTEQEGLSPNVTPTSQVPGLLLLLNSILTG